MQSTYPQTQTIIASGLKNSSRLFCLLFLALIFSSALISGIAPLAFSVATVFLFAGPHNWLEFRYFLSRLPSRAGPLNKFFLIAVSGVLILGLFYISLVTAFHLGLIQAEPALKAYSAWHNCFILWAGLVLFTKFCLTPQSKYALLLPWLALLAVANYLRPEYCGIFLVYLHPLIGLWILDCELRRSQKAWLKPYRLCLLAVPLILLVNMLLLSASASLPAANELDWQISRHAGAGIFPQFSSHLLISCHVFLEMLHYGVWIFAIPIATQGWHNWRLERISVAKNKPKLKTCLALASVFASVLVIVLAFAFSANYSATRDIYFTVAILHILAEIPFLIWLL